MLAERPARRDARQALAAMGDAIVPLLEQALGVKSGRRRSATSCRGCCATWGPRRRRRCSCRPTPATTRSCATAFAQSLTRMHRACEELAFDRAK
jgi:hypothetical protein